MVDYKTENHRVEQAFDIKLFVSKKYKVREIYTRMRDMFKKCLPID